MTDPKPTKHDKPHPWPHPACLSDEALLNECELGFGKTGGPGGQHRNKVQSLVRITHNPTGLDAHAGERRSQHENRAVALRRLRLVLAVEVRTPVPTGEIGSDLWRSRRQAPKPGHEGGRSPLGRWKGGGTGFIVVNPDHHDFPSLLAEALDVIAAAGHDAKAASLRLECSASQLIKLVAEHPPALVKWNHEREKLGLKPLRADR
jgi:hypothetical protein